MNIYLDDERPHPKGWLRFKTSEELITFMSDKICASGIETISLDHDLGDGLKTGYDFLTWFENTVYNDQSYPIPNIVIHSANPIGRANMQAAINSINRIRQNQINLDIK